MGFPPTLFPRQWRTSLVILLYHIADYSNLPHYIVQIASLLRKYYFQRPTYYYLREIALIISNLSQSPQRPLCLQNMLGHIPFIRVIKNLFLRENRKNITQPKSMHSRFNNYCGITNNFTFQFYYVLMTVNKISSLPRVLNHLGYI